MAAQGHVTSPWCGGEARARPGLHPPPATSGEPRWVRTDPRGLASRARGCGTGHPAALAGASLTGLGRKLRGRRSTSGPGASHLEPLPGSCPAPQEAQVLVGGLGSARGGGDTQWVGQLPAPSLGGTPIAACPDPCLDPWLQLCARVGLCHAQLCAIFNYSGAQPCN